MYFRVDLNRKLDIVEIDQEVSGIKLITDQGGGSYAPYNLKVDTDYRDTINIKNYIEANNLKINYSKLTEDNFMFKITEPTWVDVNNDPMATDAHDHTRWANGLYPEIKEYDPTTGILLYRTSYQIWKYAILPIGTAIFGYNPWDIDEGSPSHYWYMYSNRLSYSKGHICIVS